MKKPSLSTTAALTALTFAILAGLYKTVSAAPTMPDNSKGFASAAHDPVNDRYLLVWEQSDSDDRDIWARFVSRSGDYLAPAFPVTANTLHERQPAVAYDSVSGDFLAVWQDYRNSNWDIYGQFIDGDTVSGLLYSTSFVVAGSASFHSYNVDLAFDEDAAKFLVIWHDTPVAGGNMEVYGQFVNSAGAPSFLYSVNFPISTVTGNKGKMAVANDPVNDRFMAVWTDLRSGDSAIYGQIVDSAAAGGFLFSTDADTNLPVSTGVGGSYDPDVAYNGPNGVFTVVWSDGRGAFNDIYGQFIDADTGSPTGSSVDVNFPGSTADDNQLEPGVAIDTDGNHLVVFRSRVGDEYEIFGQILNGNGSATGTTTGENFLLAEGGTDSYYRPGAVYNPNRDNFLIYFDDMESGGVTPYEVYLLVEPEDGSDGGDGDDGGGGGGCSTIGNPSSGPVWPGLLGVTLLAFMLVMMRRRQVKIGA